MSTKKSFNPLDRGNLKEASNQLNLQMEQKTKSALEKLTEEPTNENYMIVLDEVNSDSILSSLDKQKIFKSLDDNFKLLLNDKSYLNKSLQEIENEITFYQEKGKEVVFLIGERLLFIQGEIENYKTTGKSLIGKEILEKYSDFTSYIESKFGIKRRTGYDYIDSVKFYGMRARAHESLPDYSKLRQFFPIIRKLDQIISLPTSNDEEKRSAEKERDKIINFSINFCKNHSWREVKDEVAEKKSEFFKLPNDGNVKINSYKKFKKQANLLFNEEISEDEIIDLKSLLIRLDKHFNLNVIR